MAVDDTNVADEPLADNSNRTGINYFKKLLSIEGDNKNRFSSQRNLMQFNLWCEPSWLVIIF